MYFTFKLFVVLAFIFANHVQAECTNIDLNRNTVLKDMPIWDQDGTGLCYAYSAAQLIQFELLSEGKKTIPSPLSLSLSATVFGDFWSRSELNGGNVEDLIDVAFKKGIVEQQCVEEDLKKIIKRDDITIENYVRMLHTIYNSHDFDMTDDEEFKIVLNQLAKDSYNQKCSWLAGDILKQGDWSKSVVDILKKNLLSCEEKRIKMSSKEFKIYNFGSDETMLSKVDSILDSKKPVAVSICSEIILNKNSPNKGLRDLSPPLFRNLERNVYSENCHSHAVLAVARRKHGKQCQYLIRNSWGADWNPSGYTCACKTKTKYYANCLDIKKSPHAKSEDEDKTYVGCWVNAENLGSNLLDVGGIVK